MRRYSMVTGSLFVCSALVAGCGGPVNVEGKIFRDGKPLAGAQVLFIPLGGGEQAGDLTDEEGNFRLKSPQALGIVPGEYLVTVSKMDYPPGMKRPDPHQMTMAMTAMMKQTLPAAYTLQDKTPLRVIVPRGGRNDVIIEIK